MMVESLYLSAFLMGLLGGVHCAGMCGGIVSGLTLGIPRERRESRALLLPYLLSYNGGRILSYMAAGMIVALLGTTVEGLGGGMEIRRGFTLVAAIVMILLGLYLAGWWRGAILQIERAGSLLWRLIEPVARRFIPIHSSGQALIAGLLWGWLPCGLVYTALIWALTAGTVVQGAMIMASFGIGTLPTLVGLGYFSSSLISRLQQQSVRTAAGIMVAGFGFYQLYMLYFL